MDEPNAPARDHLTGIEGGLAHLASATLDPLFWPAERLGAVSAWWLHVPFAHWIVAATAPRTLVELGTFTGVSYAAFCEAVVRSRLGTRCHAVDTWRGDPHAGEYGEEVFEEFRSFHDERYAGFSTLLRSTFDEARDHIDDGSIDLLHIDGLHTYDAVRHDFEAWTPKLSDRGVVLFHDTSERRDDFGVWILWSELRERYPGFEFFHGHGLGVLAVGPRVPPAVAALCALDHRAATTVRHRFQSLGERWLRDTSERIASREFERRRAAAESARAEAMARAEKAEGKAVQAMARAETAQALERAKEEARRRAEAERSVLLSGRASHAAREAAYQAALDQRDAEIEILTARAAQAEEYLQATFRSTSWRLTAPLRRIGSRSPTFARYGRRTLKLAWWTVTLQIQRRYRAWREAQKPGTEAGDLSRLSVPKAPASLHPVDVPEDGSSPALWFFAGDTFDWLRTHERLTGVGRVTMELFLAFRDCEGWREVTPCVLGDAGGTLVAVSREETARYIERRALAGASPGELAREPSPELARPVRRGDHVLFTGVVWTDSFGNLFRELSARGIQFSVLVYDIIPIEHPDLVGEQYSDTFRNWLETTLALASVVFVSGALVRDQILRWAIVSGLCVKAHVVPIGFGHTSVEHALSREEVKARPAVSRVEAESFVLSVGTIDTRKNQLLLCRLWSRLISEIGCARVPQLVLVGRDDLKIAALDDAFASLIEQGKLAILEGIADAELAGLYRTCLFTVFPSLSEGYGLPVAESLQYGKLCLASDLAVIHEHAGDLPWYFDPKGEEAAYGLLRKAIEDPEARRLAERRIEELYRPPSWASTCQAISNAVSKRLAEHEDDAPSPLQFQRPDVADVPAAVPAAAMAEAARWCSEVNPDVSIIVINWNSARLTLECVRQVWANTEALRYEIIVVDNGSGSRDVAPLRSLGPGVRLIELGVNRFFGEANNIAVEAARGRYVCFLNNDAFVRPGWLRHLVDALERTLEAGAAGPLFLFADNTIQEAGGAIDENGYPIRFGRGHPADETEFLVPKVVDYISAATLLLPRELFLAAGGFDLAYEPAYYEDADLCLKLRALGRSVRYCPDARVIHIEGSAANDDPVAAARRKALGDLNREKFTARWGAYLKSRSPSELERIGVKSWTRQRDERLPRTEPSGRTAIVYTPFDLTPGGGERYLLTLASVLTRDHTVTVVTPRRYSLVRLLGLGQELSIDLSACRMMTDEEIPSAPEPDLMITMGNHIIPPIAAGSANSVYICQFPFPMPSEDIQAGASMLAGYRCVLVYSEYVRVHAFAQLSAYQLPQVPIEVISPPVRPVTQSAAGKRNVILSVGRFFAGGHNKRHDLMIEVFKAVLERVGGDLELHLAGSSMPTPEHMDHLDQLREMAGDLPIFFHVNAKSEELSALYSSAAVYWHGAGLEVDLKNDPGQAEHFGIAIVEAMSAECVALAFNAGGPREIITHGVDGFLDGSPGELRDLTVRILDDGFADQRAAIGQAARATASLFTPDNFIRKVRGIAFQPSGAVSGPRGDECEAPAGRSAQRDAAAVNDAEDESSEQLSGAGAVGK